MISDLTYSPPRKQLLRRASVPGGVSMADLERTYQRGPLLRVLRQLVRAGLLVRVAPPDREVRFFVDAVAAANYGSEDVADDDESVTRERTGFVAGWGPDTPAIETAKTKYTVCPNNLPPLDDPWRVR